jgi:capsid assembly protease
MDPLYLLTCSPLWAIKPEAMTSAALQLVKAYRVAAGPDTVIEWEAASPSVLGKGDRKVAVIPIQGVLTKDGPSWYGTNYGKITQAAEEAADDPDIGHIVLSVDSPGGEVTGLPETAAVLARVASIKPVSAIVEGTSASAAYWLTSQAREVTLTPSGEVGSVGVRMMHVDISKLLDAAGYKMTELYSGDFKTEWSPFKALSDEAVANMQPRLEAMHQEFVKGVTQGRGSRVSAEMRAQRMGEGRMFSANDALKHGLVDRLQGTNDFYKAILPTQETTAPSSGFKRARLNMERIRFTN